MNTINKLKETLIKNLENTFKNLNDESIDIIIKLEDLSVKTFVKSIINSKSFNEIKLLPYVIALKSEDDEIKERLTKINEKVINECTKIENDFIYYEVLKKYFKPPQKNKYKTVMCLNDFDKLEFKTRDNYKIISLIKNKYINPYTNNIFEIDNDQKSCIITKTSFSDRSVKSDIKINDFYQYINKDDNMNYYYGLEKNFKQEDLDKFDIEFTIFHELAHALTPKYWVSEQESECISDICGILRVIKNNNFSQEQSISFLNRKLNWRSGSPVLEYLSNKLDNKNINRIHSTQFSLLILKNLINENYQYIKDLNINEEYIIATRIALLIKTENNIHAFLARNMLYHDHFRDISIEKFLNGNNLSKSLESIAEFRNINIDTLKERIKENVIGNHHNLFELMLSHYAYDDQDSLKLERSYFPFSTEILKTNLDKIREEKIDVKIEHLFSLKELKVFVENNNIKIKAKP